MFGIGMPEMLLLLVLALIIVGPQKLPQMGRDLGRAISEFKMHSETLRSAMTFDTPSSSAVSTMIRPAPQATAGPQDEVSEVVEEARSEAAATKQTTDDRR